MAYGPEVNRINYDKGLSEGGDSLQRGMQHAQAQLDALYAALNADIVRASAAEVTAGADATKLITPAALNAACNVANGLLKLDANGKAPAERLYITGALADGNIIESGNNANGRYIKWADGTMICLFNSGEVGSTTAKERICIFPCSFLEQPCVFASVSLYQSNINTTLATSFVYAPVGGIATPTSCVVAAQSIGNTPLSNGGAALLAIGRWK